jgi:hypothetical protein
LDVGRAKELSAPLYLRGEEIEKDVTDEACSMRGKEKKCIIYSIYSRTLEESDNLENQGVNSTMTLRQRLKNNISSCGLKRSVSEEWPDAVFFKTVQQFLISVIYEEAINQLNGCHLLDGSAACS